MFHSLGALVANLTILQGQQQIGDPGFVEYIITNNEANEKFTISENGLLHTKVNGLHPNSMFHYIDETLLL